MNLSSKAYLYLYIMCQEVVSCNLPS